VTRGRITPKELFESCPARRVGCAAWRTKRQQTPPPVGGALGTDGAGFRLFTEAVAGEIRCRAAESLPGSPRLGVDAELWVEPSHWREAVDSVRMASLRLHERARSPRTAGTIRTSMSAALFPMGSPADGADE
jgi:hypothetical protein